MKREEMTRDEVYNYLPQFREMSFTVTPVEFADATTGIIRSKGYTVKLYSDVTLPEDITEEQRQYASVTLTVDVVHAYRGLTFVDLYPFGTNLDELHFFAIWAVRMSRAWIVGDNRLIGFHAISGLPVFEPLRDYLEIPRGRRYRL